MARDKLRRMALRQFLEYHFDGSEAKLKIFLEQPVEAPAPDPEVLAVFGLAEPVPEQ